MLRKHISQQCSMIYEAFFYINAKLIVYVFEYKRFFLYSGGRNHHPLDLLEKIEGKCGKFMLLLFIFFNFFFQLFRVISIPFYNLTP